MGIFDSLMTHLENGNISEINVKSVSEVKDQANGTTPELSPEEHRRLSGIVLATAALSLYVAVSDNSISLDEYMEMDLNIAKINNQTYIPDDIMAEVKKIYDKQNIKWPEVTVFLDSVSDMDLIAMKEGVTKIANASDGISTSEQQVIDQFNSYIINRGQ